MLPAIPPTKRKCMCFSCQTLTTQTGHYPFVEIVPLPLTILLLSSFLFSPSPEHFVPELPPCPFAWLIWKKTLCATVVPSLSFLIPSTVLFLFCPLLFSGISCSATSSDIGGKEKKNRLEEAAHSMWGVFCHSAEPVGLKKVLKSLSGPLLMQSLSD